MTHKPNMPTWASFGQTQRAIRDHYREQARNGSLPTFREFVRFLVSSSLACGEIIGALLLGWRIVTEHNKDEENDENDKRALEASLAQLCALQ